MYFFFFFIYLYRPYTDPAAGRARKKTEEKKQKPFFFLLKKSNTVTYNPTMKRRPRGTGGAICRPKAKTVVPDVGNVRRRRDLLLDHDRNYIVTLL